MLELNLIDLESSPTNPRRRFDEAALQELADSIKSKGVLQPLLVRPGSKDGVYEVVAGERRFRAAKLAGLEAVPVVLRHLEDDEVLEVQIIENAQREDLTPLEEAEGYRQLIERGIYDVDGIAAKIGKSPSYVYQQLKLAELVPDAKKALDAGQITAGHAILMARLQPGDQEEALEFLLEDWRGDEVLPSVRGFRRWLDRELHLNLHKAPFPKKDAELYPEAGACSSCPKRTGNQPELFADLEKNDVCVDRACFETKLDRFLERQRAKLEASGEDWISLSEGYATRQKGVYAAGDWERVTKEKPACDRTVKGLLIDGPERGRIFDVCPKGPCKIHFPWLTRQAEDWDSSWRKQHVREQRKRRQKLLVRTRVLEQVRAKLKKPERADREYAARRFFDRLQQEDQKQLFSVLGLEPKKRKGPYGTDNDFDGAFQEYVQGLNGAELDRLFIWLALAPELTRDPRWHRPAFKRDELTAIAGRLKIDVGAIEEAVKAETAPKRKKKQKRSPKKPRARKGAKKAKR